MARVPGTTTIGGVAANCPTLALTSAKDKSGASSSKENPESIPRAPGKESSLGPDMKKTPGNPVAKAAPIAKNVPTPKEPLGPKKMASTKDPTPAKVPDAKEAAHQPKIECSTREKTVVKESPYEKVTPKTTIKEETWLDTYDDSLIPIGGGRRWRTTKSKQQALMKVVGVFAFIIVIIVCVLAIGFYFMHFKQDTKPGKMGDKRLITLTSQCRKSKKYGGDAKSKIIDPMCVTEKPQGGCSGRLCTFHQWVLNEKDGVVTFQTKSSGYSFVPEVSVADFTHCGDSQWCQSGKCVHASDATGWWDKSINLFPNTVPVPVEEPKCLKAESASEIQALEKMKSYTKNCTMCSSPEVKAALKVKFLECDTKTNQDHLMHGMRPRCDLFGKVEIIQCAKCPTFNATALKTSQTTCGLDPLDCKCSKGTMKDGTPCSNGGYCFMGTCYKVEKGDDNDQ